MAESLLLPVVRSVLGKAADALVQKVTRMWGVDDDRRDLELKLLFVQSLLADAEVKAEAGTAAARAVKAWMKELRAAAYQADDVLDDFQYEALRREAQSLGSTTSKVLDNFTSRNPLVFRHKASRDLKNVLDKIHKLVEDMKKFDLLQREPVAPQTLYRQTHSALDESADILGRDNEKKVVVKLLLDQKDQRNVQVLPIIGMGGLGKTTLAKMVYNDSKVQRHFELKMWHCVSDNFEAISVVRSIIELAMNTRCDLPDTIELLRGKLQEVIGRKRFLLILDDVWNEEPHKWEDDLKPLLCSSNAVLGSMIIVTSRSQKVASIMGTLPHHELACLSDDDSWQLFSKKAFFQGVQKQTELIKIGKLIVNRCKGLPLALNTMGGLMSTKTQIKEWEAIAEDGRVGKDGVLSILKLSYRHLSSEMKQCFAFCAVFPKDHEMDKDTLIQLWTANNFIHGDGTTDFVQKGEFIFNELVWRSFIQDVNVKIFDDTRCPPYKTIGCKMHDLMHDLAKVTTDECASETDLRKTLTNNVRHIHLSSSESKQQITRLMENSYNLHSLLTESWSWPFGLSQSDYKALMKLKLTSLRALCLQSQSVIHRKLIDSTHLRYLDLSRSLIVTLSNTVCMLYNLQSLILNYCRHLEYLPEDMQTMRKLTHIYLIGCCSLKQMPPKLRLLHNLCTLTKFIVDYGDGFGIEELKDLRQLGNGLELLNLRKVKSGSKANLHEKKNLTELFLYWGHNESYNPLDGEVIGNNEEEVLESLAPHVELKTLGLYGYGGLSVSQWMRDPQMFQCLRELCISMCPRCKDLPLLWMSSSLEKLYLDHMDSLSALCKNIDMEATGNNNTFLPIFPKLNMMRLSNLPWLERWAENSAGEPNSLVVFPQLEELHIINCNKIATFPESPALTSLNCYSKTVEGPFPMGMPLGSSPSLVRLEIGVLVDMVIPVKDHRNENQRRPLDSLRSLRVHNDNGFISVFNSSKKQLGLVDCLAFVEKLKISSCNNILHWPVEEFRCLVGLRSLEINSCNKLQGNGSSSEEILPLPQLERLGIYVCDSLLEIPKLPDSLAEMEICWCKSLVALPSNLGDLPKLRNLCLWGFHELKTLPDGMDGVTSLERLDIAYCPGIDTFPQGFLQRLPGLRFLKIMACPDLQRRCREGGEYFDFVSPIPEKEIPAATEPQMKKFMQRFLPLCGGGDSQSN